MRIVLVMVACLCITCRPSDKPSLPDRVWNIGPRALWDDYRDGNHRWTGQRVRVNLGKNNYEVSSGEVRWHDRDLTKPPDLVFVVGRNTPANNLKPVTIEGTVYGPVVDDFDRGFRVNWYVRIDTCVVIGP